MWENAYYIWNPATNQTTPKTTQDYSYNPATGAWDTNDFKYDPTTKTYIPNTPPPAPVTSNTVAPATTGTSDLTGTNTTEGTGPGSTNTTSTSSTNDQTYNNFYNAAISNRVVSLATTGDAGVVGNTTGGSATTGNATDTATILNLLQSTTSFDGTNGITTFTSNINGNVTGDLLIDPALIAALQPAASSNGPTDSTLTVNNALSTAISNNITLGATTGDANVANNTTGGDATSGDANAVANVVNVANSTVNAGQTFIGTINIYGNLNGDILLPANMLQSLISSNSAASGATTSNNLDVNNANATSIANNVVTNAVSGTASTAGNTTAGSANTGNATTNVTILNLTGQQVVAADSLLVFVNVLGQWVGLIMNAPAGSTAAALAGGATSNSTASSGSTDTTINNTNNTDITNSIHVAAKTGDATVTNNTTGGNATTGDATASANVLNIANDSFALSNWFGVLFINVFGMWGGSFGVNTSAGDLPSSSETTTTTDHSDDTSASTTTATTANIHNSGNQNDLGLVLASQTSANTPGSSASTADTSLVASKKQAVLGASTHASAAHATNFSWQFPAMGLAISGALIAIERYLALRKKADV